MNTVRDIMSSDLVTASSQDNMYEISVKMKQNDTGFMPVVDSGKCIGVVTDRDIVLRGVAEKKPGSTPVTEIMSQVVHEVSPDISVDEVAEIMASKQIRRMIICEHGKILGVVSLGDLAVRHLFMDNAGGALSEISEHVH